MIVTNIIIPVKKNIFIWLNTFYSKYVSDLKNFNILLLKRTNV